MSTAEFIIDHSADDAAERKQEVRKVLWAFLAALFLHLLVAFSLAAWSGALSPAFPAEEKPIELTFVDLATPAPIVPKNSMFIENDESKQTAEPTEKTFESNANSVGASEVAATGSAPLPSQEGKERPFLEMQTQQHSLAVDGAQPQPSAPPMQTPQPSQAPTAVPTPGQDQFALLTKSPTPPPIEKATPAKAQPPKTAYRPEKQQTRIAGNISNRGRSSVNAVATPLGRYQKQLYDAVGSRWYLYVGRDRDLISIGTARLVFSVDRSGRVANLKVVDNSSNEAFANVCLQSVLEIQLPPIPEDVASTLPPEGLEEDMSFTIYAN